MSSTSSTTHSYPEINQATWCGHMHLSCKVVNTCQQYMPTNDAFGLPVVQCTVTFDPNCLNKTAY